jgi:hypothetical protein
MEHQLDETMAKMRRNLMVIRLLGLLSEDNGLQDSLMAESDRLATPTELAVLLGNQCCGSGIRCLFDPGIRNRFFSGSRISDPGSQTQIF